ncbi:hypothetical protein [Mesorhizobium sp. BH1-1-4]|uniref:hypothetical protein n=1 Tax=Mesorhizobium sp. BH1-1-4 TaxID=2876662 RepID=UPI001CD0EC2F|nr:hypothetical protein [Mesorhizobium sp. BH1-1-4]MBZ9992855.1 hypothetical protein [Mesorhizobium sp. BH1-1-4]
MDQYLQMLGSNIDGMGHHVNAMSTKVELLTQKIDAIYPQKRLNSALCPSSPMPKSLISMPPAKLSVRAADQSDHTFRTRLKFREK